nr:hypothetical protein [Tanacetum cinerariifolium]
MEEPYYIENRKNGRMILNSVENGPLIWPIVEENDKTRKKKYEGLSASEKLQADCDLKATNIVLQGLPPDVYDIVNHHKVTKETWNRGETLYQYYWRFAQLINDMHIFNMTMRPVQVNAKFLNNLSPEWSKFVTDVKLARDLHTTNYVQLYSYLQQHEYPQQASSNFQHSSQPYTPTYAAPHLPQPQISHPTSSVPPSHQYQSQISLVVSIFNLRDDPIACLNKAMTFMSGVASSRFPSTTNQLRSSSNPKNQATIQDDRVTVQQVQGGKYKVMLVQ